MFICSSVSSLELELRQIHLVPALIATKVIILADDLRRYSPSSFREYILFTNNIKELSFGFSKYKIFDQIIELKGINKPSSIHIFKKKIQKLKY